MEDAASSQSGATIPDGKVQAASGWPVPDLLSQVEGLYRANNAAGYWPDEKHEVEARLHSLEQRLSDRYLEPIAFALGGSGIVLRMLDSQLASEPVVLKFPRPVPGKAELLAAMMKKEISHLVKLRHGSIVRIHSTGQLPTSSQLGDFPFYLMDFVEGSSSAKYLKDQRETLSTSPIDTDNLEELERQFLSIIRATIDALNYLHVHDVAHLDIKPDNVLINRDRLPVIADLGTAKVLRDKIGTTTVAATFGYSDPCMAVYLDRDPSDNNRVKGDIPRLKIEAKWDLYSLGQTLLTWLGFDIYKHQRRQEPSYLVYLKPYTRKYLLLMAARLLHGHVEPWLEDHLDLDRRFLEEIAYSEMAAVGEDIRKLTGEFSLTAEIPELDQYSQRSIQLGEGTPAPFSERVRKLVEHRALDRLATVSQLGLVRFVYPTARHSRQEHSLGSFHNACRFVRNLYYDPLSPLFRQIVSTEDIRTVLVATLLHDAGQFPMAHDLEEIDDKLFNHKSVGISVVRGVRDTKRPGAKKIRLKDLDGILRTEWKVSTKRVVQILEAKPDDANAPVKDRILHTIFDGPIDADKLDYLPRDSRELGVPYGLAIDEGRIFRSLTVVLVRGDRPGEIRTACVGVHEKGKIAAEFVSIARWAMFSQAYWHHAVRSTKAMLSRAVGRLLATADERGDTWRFSFQYEFERLVLALPGALYSVKATQRRLPVSDAEIGSEVDDMDGLPSDSLVAGLGQARRLEATDSVVLAFLRSNLVRLHANEAELIDDLLRRELYKRLFVFSEERSKSDWRKFVDTFPKSASQRIRVYEQLEAMIATAVDEEAARNPLTLVFDSSHMDRLRRRMQARKPLILIDIPGARPGSEIPLYYVVESQRRQLRKGDHVIGDVQPSDTWNEFALHLSERAGKVRIFCHPDVCESVEAAVPREEFVRLFDRAVEEVVG